jgi:hypothetical protein
MDKLLRCGGGTLGVVLARRDFIVISIDSRRTDHFTGQHDDNCRKLFPVGQYRTLAIAGLVDAKLTRQPSLTAQVVPLLEEALKRGEQWHDLEWKDKPPPPDGLPENLRLHWGQSSYSWWTSLSGPLQTIYNIAYTLSDIDLTCSRLEAVIAGFSENGEAKIDYLSRTPQKTLSNWGRKCISFVSTQEQLRSTGPLIWKTIGVTDLADRVLGDVITDDLKSRLHKFPSILSYVDRRAAGTIDSIPHSEMIELAEDIIRATAQWTKSVGDAPIQTATIKPREPAKINQPIFPTSRALLSSDGTWHLGVEFTPEYPFDERQRGVVYAHCSVKHNKTAIPLGNNYFYGNEFKSAIFQYSGGEIAFGDNNLVENCTVFISEGVDAAAVNSIPFTRVKIRGKYRFAARG